MNQMRAAVLYGVDDIRVESVRVPEIEADEILVRVKAAGICGSDLPRVLGQEAHYYPIVLGHEFAGEVAEIGKEVTGWKIGDRVAGAPLLPCHTCVDCLKGHYAQCSRYSFTGSRVNGGWAEYVKIPGRNAVSLPESVSYEEGAFIEPATVALHALRLIDYSGGEDVAILGAGTIGLLVLQWAKLLGAKTVTVFDIDGHRLEFAGRLGADRVVNSAQKSFLEEAQSKNGRGFGMVIECAGSVETMNLSFELASNKAKVCFVGTPAKEVSFPYKLFEKINRKEFTLAGSWMSYSAPFPGKEWELAAHYMGNGKLRLIEMIHRAMPLERIREAFDLYKKGGVKGKMLLLP